MSTYCYDVYPRQNTNIDKMRKRLLSRGFEEKSNAYGPYFYIEANGFESFYITNLITKYNYKYRRYEKRWARSDNYRNEFFEHNHGPYRCAYCGKKLKSKDMEIDHLIPVSKAKTSKYAQTLLKINFINNVNNYRNLVPACRRCNRAKSDKMGGWVILGMLGRHKGFWKIRPILITAIIITAVIMMYNSPTISNAITEFFTKL